MTDQEKERWGRIDVDPDPELPKRDAWIERRLRRHFLFGDHAIIRPIWPNFTQIGPGIFRSSQPSPQRIRALHRRGLRNVINLRGANASNSFYYLENRVCHGLGINLLSINFFPAGMLPPADSLLKFHRFVSQAGGDVLFHCKSGADRTGLAAALYVLMFQQNDIARARTQLTWRHLHLRSRKMGIFDHVIDAFEEAHRKTGIDILDWIATAYDPVRLRASYAARID